MTTPVETILPPNATPLERALEAAVGARIEGMPVPIDTLLRPDSCPENLLAWLAWSLSVDRWDPDWPAATKRSVIAASVRQHRRKGTPSAVGRALDDIGAIHTIDDQKPNGPHHTMDITIFNSATLLSSVPDARAQIDQAKRLSVHATLTLAAGFMSNLGIAAGVSLVGVARFEASA